MPTFSQHASVRMQQRGIGLGTVELLLSCGTKEYDHRGAVVVYFDKAARRRTISRLGGQHSRELQKQFNTYVVLSNAGDVITVGHRIKRINHN